jgi:hypothetical protein
MAVAFDRELAFDGRAAVLSLLQATTAYDLMAESSKVVVFDVAIPLRTAFYALVEHGE